jgi:hypothetical protein
MEMVMGMDAEMDPEMVSSNMNYLNFSTDLEEFETLSYDQISFGNGNKYQDRYGDEYGFGFGDGYGGNNRGNGSGFGYGSKEGEGYGLEYRYKDGIKE